MLTDRIKVYGTSCTKQTYKENWDLRWANWILLFRVGSLQLAAYKTKRQKARESISSTIKYWPNGTKLQHGPPCLIGVCIFLDGDLPSLCVGRPLRGHWDRLSTNPRCGQKSQKCQTQQQQFEHIKHYHHSQQTSQTKNRSIEKNQQESQFRKYAL